LWFWWLFSPRRLWSRAFVARVAALRLPPAKPEGLPSAPSSLDPLGHATFLSLALHGREKPPAGSVLQVARAWEDALGNELRSRLFARATLIGGGDPDEALDEVRRLVEAALGPSLSGPMPDDVPSLVASSMQARRDELYAQLEDRIERLDERKDAHRELPALEEWREVLGVVKLYREACEAGGLGERGLAHSIIKDKFVNYGAWLYNTRDERALANAIFVALRDEAKLLGDEEAERLNTKNANCDL
jgi:hypothetical protein